MALHECIVVGSGCTGAMAAQTLVELGARVTLLDVGAQDTVYKHLIPDTDFTALRQTDHEQHRYFLGDDFAAIPWGAVKTGAQLTAPRRFIIELVERLLPLHAENFSPMESLALGGLGSGWGIGCNVFSASELEACGLNPQAMQGAYRIVAERIGVSATRDDATPYTIGDLDNALLVSAIDSTAAPLLQRYQRKKARLNGRGFFLGRPALALLTQDRDGRKKSTHHDLDFYSDKEQSAYRPWITIERLKRSSSFEYIGSTLVLRFLERPDSVEVHGLNTDTNEKTTFMCKKLVLASGVFGTARIVLRSLSSQDRKLPLLCNPYTYLPCLQPTLIGAAVDRYRTSFAQLMLFHDETRKNFDVAQASIYSYRSLLLFRLVKEAPFNFHDGRILMQYLLPAFTIAGVHHPIAPSENKHVRLIRDDRSPTGDALAVEYILSEAEQHSVRMRERKFKWALRNLHCYPIKQVNPGHGSSIHYAGTLPFSSEEKEFTLSPEGRLHGTQRIFVADGSGFRYAPAKGLTFSLMANAQHIATKVFAHA
jgi:hypothetical protein